MMSLKTIRIKDIYGQEVLVSGEEIARGFEEVLANFFEARFLWLFVARHEPLNKKAIKFCARATAKDLMRPLNTHLDADGTATPLEEKVLGWYKFGMMGEETR